MRLPELRLFRHPEIVTQRPYGFDLTADGWLWEACGAGTLYAHHINTGEVRLVTLPESRGHSINQMICFGGQLVGIVPDYKGYLLYDPVTGACSYPELPGDNTIVWYGGRLPDGRLALYDRGMGRLLLLDEPGGAVKAVVCPFAGSEAAGHIANGQVLGDGLSYSFVRDPAKIIRYDIAADRFVDEIPFAVAEAGPSGCIDADGVAYIADSAGGRLLPFDMRTGRWLDPLPVPGHGSVFGFIGSCQPFQGCGYFSLSTYRFPSRIDPRTGDLILPDGWEIGVDGRRPPRFLDRQLAFDPATGAFDFLTVPAQPDGTPLICYAYGDAERLIFTGYLIPPDERGHPSDQPGQWLVWQHIPAHDRRKE